MSSRIHVGYYCTIGHMDRMCYGLRFANMSTLSLSLSIGWFHVQLGMFVVVALLDALHMPAAVLYRINAYCLTHVGLYQVSMVVSHIVPE